MVEVDVAVEVVEVDVVVVALGETIVVDVVDAVSLVVVNEVVSGDINILVVCVSGPCTLNASTVDTISVE